MTLREPSVIGAAVSALFALSLWGGWEDVEPRPGLHAPGRGVLSVEGDLFPRVLADADGYRFVLPAPPRRIVSTTLMTDEMLLALVDRDRVHSVTFLAANPFLSNVADLAGGIPATGMSSVEEIIAARPDLVLAARLLRPEFVDLLKKAGIPVLEFDRYKTLDEIRECIRLAGKALGTEDRASGILAGMDRSLAHARRAAALSGERPRVLYLTPSGHTIGSGTVFDEILAAAGGRNAAAEAGFAGYRRIALETAVTIDPDVLLVPGEVTGPDETLEGFARAFREDPVWSSTRAVREGRLVVIPGKRLTAISQFVTGSAEEIGRALHPAAWRAMEERGE